MEAIQMSIRWRLDKQNVVCPHNGVLFSHKKSEDWPRLQHKWALETLRWEKKPDKKGHKLCDSIFMKCPEQANLQRQKAD